MKKCTICKVYKEENQFNKNRRRKDGLNNVCRDCSKEILKQHYKDNIDRYKKKSRIRNIIVREKNKEITDIVKINGCIICGELELCCLDFHHLDPLFKENSISNLAGGAYSSERLIEEIKKCVVLCSNCHRKVHNGKIIINGEVA